MAIGKIKTLKYMTVVIFGLALSTTTTADMAGMSHNKAQSKKTESISEMMHDIGDHMVVIAGDLEYGTLNLEQQKAMAEHVRNMALMMDEMSQMMDSAKEKQNHHKSMTKMRKQMDKMMKEVSAGTMKPW